jgi:beta-lactamase regulating signal transducer with metallopeptidase domain
MNPMNSMNSTMIAGVSPLLLFVAKATLVLLAAVAAKFVLRRSTAGARHLVWLAALVGVLALPLLGRIPSLRIPVGVGRWAMVDGQSAGPVAAILDGQPASAIQLPSLDTRPYAQTPTRPYAHTPTRPATPPSLITTLLIAWAGVALSLLVWLIAGAVQVHRIVAKGRELSTSDWTTPLCEVADRLDLDVPPRLLISDDIEMAFACRALEPTIVLPANAQSWTDDRRRAVLFHELAHVKRHDLLGHTLGRIACALYWFHPLVWTAAKELRAESERACDDLVLSCGARPSEYAQHLLDMVTSVRRAGAPVMAMPMARKKEFEGRMLAILDPAVRRAAPGRAQSAMVVATLGVLSLTVAAVSPANATTKAKVIENATAKPGVILSEPSERRTPVAAVPSTTARPEAVPVAQPEPHVEVSTNTNTLNKMVTQLATQVSVGVSRAFSGQHGAVDTARVALLIRVLQTDADATVRRSAAWALNEMPTTGARAALIKALREDSDERVREMSAWALSEFESDESATAIADALIKDKSVMVRRTAAWTLGQFDRASGVDALMGGVNDADSKVRETAIWALGQHNLRRAPASVMNALTDPSPAIRSVAAWTLGGIEDTSSVHALARAFETETDTHVRVTELWALSNIGEVPTSVMETAMKSNDTELRRRGVALLGGNGSWPWPWPWPWPRPSP